MVFFKSSHGLELLGLCKKLEMDQKKGDFPALEIGIYRHCSGKIDGKHWREFRNRFQ